MHLFHDGNTYTPNERPYPGQRSRTWKCSLYYRLKYRARIVTSEADGLPKLRADIVFIVNNVGGLQLCVDGYPFIRSRTTDEVQYWTCNQRKRLGCPVRASVRRREKGQKPLVKLSGCHNHLIITELKRRYAGAQLEYRGGDVTFSPSCRGMPKMTLEGYVYIRNAGNATKTYWLCERGKRFKCRALKRRYVGAQIEYRGRGVTFSIRRGRRCMPKMTLEGYVYRRNAGNAIKTYWRCEREKRFKCRARAITYQGTGRITINEHSHNHMPGF
nr:FLYWCH-type zinc finger-containing protein 1-like [Aedes albopictus]